jgi:hypothetical protein
MLLLPAGEADRMEMASHDQPDNMHAPWCLPLSLTARPATETSDPPMSCPSVDLARQSRLHAHTVIIKARLDIASTRPRLLAPCSRERLGRDEKAETLLPTREGGADAEQRIRAGDEHAEPGCGAIYSPNMQ